MHPRAPIRLLYLGDIHPLSLHRVLHRAHLQFCRRSTTGSICRGTLMWYTVLPYVPLHTHRKSASFSLHRECTTYVYTTYYPYVLRNMHRVHITSPCHSFHLPTYAPPTHQHWWSGIPYGVTTPYTNSIVNFTLKITQREKKKNRIISGNDPPKAPVYPSRPPPHLNRVSFPYRINGLTESLSRFFPVPTATEWIHIS